MANMFRTTVNKMKENSKRKKRNTSEVKVKLSNKSIDKRKPSIEAQNEVLKNI